MKHCDCGNVATLRKNGEHICQRCADMECMKHLKAMAGVKHEEGDKPERDYSTYWTGDLTPICGMSLKRIAHV